jgi:hypothetical protein
MTSTFALLFTTAFLAYFFLLSPSFLLAGLLTGSPEIILAGVLGTSVTLGTMLTFCRWFGIAKYTVFAPVAAVLHIAGFSSGFWRFGRAGVVWKGVSYRREKQSTTIAS